MPRTIVAAGAAARPAPRRRPEPALPSRRPPHPPLHRLGRDRRADQPPLRLLHRAAFRRLPRGDGPRPPPRHGDPHLRRRALHGRRRARGGLLPRMGAGRVPGTGRARRRSRSSSSSGGVVFNYRGSWCAERRADELGDRPGASSATRGTLIWDGYDDLRAEVATDQPVPGDPVLRMASAGRRCRRSTGADRIGGHLGVMRDFVAAVRDRSAAGDARRRQHQEPRHGVRRDRERRDRAARYRSGCTAQRQGRFPHERRAPRHPHRHHDPGQRRRSGRLCPADPRRTASRASSRSSGRRSATRTSRGSPAELREAIGDRDVTMSTLGMFGNPLEETEIDRETLRRLGDADRQRPPLRRDLHRRLHRPRPRQADRGQPAALQGGVRPPGEARRRQGRHHRLRELRHGRQLGERRLEHRPQSRRLGADVRRAAGRQYRPRMGAVPPARLPDRSDPADPQMGAEDSSTSTARTRPSAGT